MNFKKIVLSGLLSLACASVALAQNQWQGLTVVPSLQTRATELLKGKQGCVVAIRPETGEILCMVSNSTSASKINRAITGIYAPGSTFKVAQALCLRSEGVIDENAHFVCNMGFDAGKTHIGCHRHAPALNMTQAIAQSCNTWFCQAFMGMIGDTELYGSHTEALDTWYAYMRSMGFGHTLGIDMKNEAAGFIPSGQWMDQKYGNRWNSYSTLYLGMGQGQLTVTPLQLCNLAATIANRGYYRTPYIHTASRERQPEKYAEKHYTLATPQAYQEVIRGMRQAVAYGTCRTINLPQYNICGKTGTVENSGADHAVFIGFAPMDHPTIALAVYIEHGGFGADTAVPIASEMFKTWAQTPAPLQAELARAQSPYRKR